MRFGAVPLHDALGAILAHSANLKGGRLRKGKVLEQGDLDRMAAEGWQDVIVAQLTDADMHEDVAAKMLATALASRPFGAVRLTPAATGRVNLFAKAAGVVSFDPQVIHAVNAVNPLITVATLPPYKRVAEGDMIATVKIIAYGVPKIDVGCAVQVAKPMQVRTPVARTATLIETRIGDAPSLKGRQAMQTRLARLRVTLDERVVVPHESGAVAEAINAARGDAVFLLTASATSDPNDVGPAAVQKAGGRVLRFGIPVDPGNLLFLGERDGPVKQGKGTMTPIVGLPGCARSLALNGADWIIERVLCGVRITDQMVNEMGVGGLLKEPPSRPQPRTSVTSLD